MWKIASGLFALFAVGLAATGLFIDPGGECVFFDQLDNCVTDTAGNAVANALYGIAATCAAAAGAILIGLRARLVNAR